MSVRIAVWRLATGFPVQRAALGDSGGTWSFVDPTPADAATDVWSVVVHHGGIIDTCGDDGHRRSIDGAATWTTAGPGGTPLPASTPCSITASPQEPYVLFAVVGTSVFESDDAGGTWDTQFANPALQGRIPFVRTNNRSGPNFDLTSEWVARPRPAHRFRHWEIITSGLMRLREHTP
jgi:hypothetical protein